MNIEKVNNINFNSRSERDITPYNPRKNRRHNIDRIISMEDNDVRRLAYIKTISNTEDKKHKNLSTALVLSTPFAASAASALLEPAKFKLFSRDLKGASARVLNGVKGGGKWGIMLGVAYGINKVKQYFEDKSPNFDRFTSENPFLTFGASVAAFAGALALGGKAVNKIGQSIIKNTKPQSIIKADNKIAKYADKFNSNSVVTYISKQIRNLRNSQSLEPLKAVGKWALSWSPALLLGGAVAHEFVHGRKKDIEFVKNYSDIKDMQTRLAQARIRELSVQNKALKAAIVSQNS